MVLNALKAKCICSIKGTLSKEMFKKKTGGVLTFCLPKFLYVDIFYSKISGYCFYNAYKVLRKGSLK